MTFLIDHRYEFLALNGFSATARADNNEDYFS
jgi:hypothetical protein